MRTYTVTLQKHDTQTGSIEVEEVTYSAGWDPEKVGLEMVARSCAAEHTCSHGFAQTPQGPRPNMVCVGLTARELEPEEELAQT